MQATCAAKILRPRTGASDEAPGFCGWVVIERLSPTTFYGIVSIKTIPRFWTIEEQSKSIELLVIKAYPFVK